MSDFDHDWGMEHELHVDHDGGVDHGLVDTGLTDAGLSDVHTYEGHDAYADATHEGDAGHDLSHDGHDLTHEGHDATHEGHDYAGEGDHLDTHHDDQPAADEHDLDLPDWQLDTSFLDGHYDLVGADPDENDMWSQFMTDMHEEINPYAAN